MEVREAYCCEDFDWGTCRQLATERIREGNVRLLRQHAASKFGAGLRDASLDGPGEAGGGKADGEAGGDSAGPPVGM